MTPQPDFHLAEWSQRASDLLARGRKLVASAPEPAIQALADQLPQQLYDAQGPPRIVFVGQYSAGKSSLVRALTGRTDIAIGAGITTDVPQTLDWHGLVLIDTPGIHTGLRPEHDARSYQAIASADLVVFVLTNELMDSRLVTHFRELAIDRHKAAEMILVVNKMDRAADTPALRATIRAQLAKVVAPVSLDTLPVVFVSAGLALDATAESDPERAAEDLAASGLADLTDALNLLAAERGTAARLTTALYELEHALMTALAAATTSGDPAIEGLEALLLQKRRLVAEAMRTVRNDAVTTIQSAASGVRARGRDVSETISSTTKADEFEKSLDAEMKAVDEVSRQLNDDLQSRVEQAMGHLHHELDLATDSGFAQQVSPLLADALRRAAQAAAISPGAADKGQKAARGAEAVAKFLVKHGFNSDASTFGGLFKLRGYSGTPVHEAVKTIGKWVNHSFKPWGAVKLAQKIVVAGRVLGVVGAIAGVFFQIAEDIGNAREEKRLIEARAEVRNNFNATAGSIEMTYNKAIGAFIADNLQPEFDATGRQLDELLALQEHQSASFDELLALLTETRSLIAAIQGAARAA